MRKGLRKLAAVVLTAAMALSVGTPAFAASAENVAMEAPNPEAFVVNKDNFTEGDIIPLSVSPTTWVKSYENMPSVKQQFDMQWNQALNRPEGRLMISLENTGSTSFYFQVLDSDPGFGSKTIYSEKINPGRTATVYFDSSKFKIYSMSNTYNYARLVLYCVPVTQGERFSLDGSVEWIDG